MRQKQQYLTMRLGSYKPGDILSVTLQTEQGGECFEFKVKKYTKVGAVEKFFNKCLNIHGIYVTK